MDAVELDLTRQKAGAEYLTALERLGLQPEALFWSFDELERRFVLVLATEMFDFKGPLAVSELLFKAYNASATPADVDPFIVRLHSPNHAIIRALDRWKVSSPGDVPRYGLAEDQKHLEPAFASINITIGGLNYRDAWVYRFELPSKQKSIHLLRRWNRFNGNVNRLAA